MDACFEIPVLFSFIWLYISNNFANAFSALSTLTNVAETGAVKTKSLLTITNDAFVVYRYCVYLGLARKDIEPSTPSSILASLVILTLASPSICPFKRSAICFAENSIYFSLKFNCKVRKFQVAAIHRILN